MTAAGGSLPDHAYAAALASVRGIGPRTLRRLLDAASPAEAWAQIVRGDRDDVDPSLRHAASEIHVGELWAAYRQARIGVILLGEAPYPARLAADTEAPAVLFHLGDPSVVDRTPVVALVGTRSATRYGLGVAAQLGADLSTTGVAVASGLAIGIDGAAHEGACAGRRVGGADAAPPIAVVANGLDDPYPRRHARLWQRVAEAGVVLSETPIGIGAEKWRFPLRNRLLAAMADVLVVVECHARGGSLSTVDAALERGVSVGAVPGSIRSPASAGTNALLADGCFPVRDLVDVLVAVNLVRATPLPRVRPRRAGVGVATDTLSGAPTPGPPGAGSAGPGPPAEPGGAGPSPLEAAVVASLGWEPCSIEQLLARTGHSLGEVSEALERLASAGTVVGEGGWWQRC